MTDLNLQEVPNEEIQKLSEKTRYIVVLSARI